MDFLLTEILQKIFSYLPQRYVTTVCSKICKTWYKAIITPFFYSTLRLPSEQQLKKIIQLTKHYSSIGSYVQQIHFHDLYISKNEQILIELTTLFPSLQAIHNLNKHNRIYKEGDFEYTYNNNGWLSALINSNNAKNIENKGKLLEFEIADSMVNINLQQQRSIIHLKYIRQSILPSSLSLSSRQQLSQRENKNKIYKSARLSLP
ncbi:unnamed protein product [Cunninghamella echinulata]